MFVISARCALGHHEQLTRGAQPPVDPGNWANAGLAMVRLTRSGSANRKKTRAVLVRLEEQRDAVLRGRARQVGLTSAALVRQLIDRELAGECQAVLPVATSGAVPIAVNPNLTRLWQSVAHTTGILVQIAKLLRERRDRELHAHAEIALKECRVVLAEVARLAGRPEQ